MCAKVKSCQQLNDLEFLVLKHSEIKIANNRQSTIDSKIKRIRSVHQGRRQSLLFLVKGPPGATGHAYK